MPRTLPPELTTALDSGNFNAYFLLTVKEAGFGILRTVEPVSFKLSGIEMTVKYPAQVSDVYDGFGKPEDITFMLTRGVTIGGVNYTIDSSDYFGVSSEWDGIFETITASMLPNTAYAAPGDLTYSQVLTALCAAHGKTAVFKKPSAAWLNYQYLPTGKTLILNKSSLIIQQIKQKYVIYACDNGNNEILFCAIASDWGVTSDHTLQIERFNANINVQNNRRFISRDENESVTYSGNTDAPLWNLGFLPSTAAHPASKQSGMIEIKPIAPHLKYLSFDYFTFSFDNYPDVSYDTFGIRLAWVEEEFDTKNKIAWSITIKEIDWGKGAEGGQIPGTLERVAAYTPLVTTNFNNNLDDTINNLQALAERVDDLPLVYNPVTADVDFNGFKAIAMACDNGATLPLAPTQGQWFLHTATGRNFLLQYINGAWSPLFSFGDAVIYVSPTGTDSQDKGFGTGTDAYLTWQYAFDQCPQNGNGGLTINIGAGTYTGTAILQEKTYATAIQIIGERTLLGTATITSAVKGVDGTRGSITVTGAGWTTDIYKGMYVETATGDVRCIETNTTDTLTIVGTFSDIPSGIISLYTCGTIIDTAGAAGIQFNAIDVSFLVEYCQFTDSQGVKLASTRATGTFRYCQLFENTDFRGSCSFVYSDIILLRCAFLVLTGAGNTCISVTGYRFSTNHCLFDNRTTSASNFCIVPVNQAVVNFQGGGSTFINWQYAVFCTSSQVLNITAGTSTAQGHNIFRLSDTAIRLQIGCTIQNFIGTYDRTPIGIDYQWDMYETVINRYQIGDTPAFTVPQLARISRSRMQVAEIGQTRTDVQGDGRKIYNVTHTTEGITSPSNPVMGDIWIDTN